MDLIGAARDLASCLSGKPRLVRLAPHTPTAFVGDIHGDLDAVERVLVAAKDCTIVFLGDLVDRGPRSREVVARVVAAKLDRPDSVHVLMGNHEAWGCAKFRPADFWESLSPGEETALASALLGLPFAAWHPAGVLALHGALPDLPSVAAIEGVELGSRTWRDITWGDWGDELDDGALPPSRPRYGARVFSDRARRLDARVLVRSHQPDAPLYLHDGRCLTLFTSSAYGDARRLAVLPADRDVRTARDLDLIEL